MLNTATSSDEDPSWNITESPDICWKRGAQDRSHHAQIPKVCIFLNNTNWIPECPCFSKAHGLLSQLSGWDVHLPPSFSMEILGLWALTWCHLFSEKEILWWCHWTSPVPFWMMFPGMDLGVARSRPLGFMWTRFQINAERIQWHKRGCPSFSWKDCCQNLAMSRACWITSCSSLWMWTSL